MKQCCMSGSLGYRARKVNCSGDKGTSVVGRQHPFLNAGYQHTFYLVLK